MKPLIGITCNYDCCGAANDVTHATANDQDWNYLAVDYVRAIEMAGGIPVMIPQYRNVDEALTLLTRLDGLVLSGGNDIVPSFYHEEIRDCSGNFFPMRDELELRLAGEALRLKKPLLGICRGLQVMNVAFGGTMYQDLRENSAYGPHRITAMPRCFPSHTVHLRQGTLLREIFGQESIQTNSFHHQAVHTLPENATVCATTSDGLVEGVSYGGGHPFTLGVQWHPEMMQCHDTVQRRIFTAFVSTCVSQQ